MGRSRALVTALYPIVAVAILVGIVTIIISITAHVWNEKLDVLEVTAALGFVILVIPFILENWFNTKELTIKFMKEEPIQTVMEQLEGAHPFIRTIAKETMDDQIKSINPTSRGFSIDSTDWAMRANGAFWKNLHQHARELDRRKKDFNCYVLHCSDPRLWNEYSAVQSLEEQERLISLGDRIHIKRIIVGQVSKEDVQQAIQGIKKSSFNSEFCLDDRLKRQVARDSFKRKVTDPHRSGGQPDALVPTAEDYANALILMQLHAITTYYYSQRDPSTEDFAVFSLDGKEIVMKWLYKARLGRVDRCEFFEETQVVYEDWWRRLENHAILVKDELLKKD